jgi:hypothetical protein
MTDTNKVNEEFMGWVEDYKFNILFIAKNVTVVHRINKLNQIGFFVWSRDEADSKRIEGKADKKNTAWIFRNFRS